MESRIVYYEQAGQENTEETLRVVKQRAEELGIKSVIIASTGGTAAVKAAEALGGLSIIAVSHSTGFKKPDTQEFSEENRKLFESKGGTVLTGTHLFAGVSRAMKTQFNTMVIGDIVSSVLRIFGEGMKVCCEIATMAADAGLVRTDEDIIAIGGTGHGSDTAVLLTPVTSQNFFSMKVKEILCKPHF